MAAYYYPGFHKDPRRDILARGGDSGERLLLDDPDLRAAYPDVRRPHPPLVEPSPETVTAEARLAQRYGIGAFLWCWYWDRGDLLFNTPLEHFLRAVPTGFRYALMWTNKRPHFKLPLHRTHNIYEHRSRLVQTDGDDFRRMFEHLAEAHFSRPYYLRIGGRPVLSVFLVRELMRQHGTTGVRRLLDTAQDVVRSHGMPGICFVGIVHKLRPHRPWVDWFGLGRYLGQMDLAAAGFSAASTYVLLPHWDGPVEQPYQQLVDERPALWPLLEERLGVPLWPSVSPGWDARLRGVPSTPLPTGHPWAPVVRDETPAEFAHLLKAWRQFAEPRRVPVLPIASWNEWTEGHAIAPCDKHRDGMLRVVRDFVEAGGTQPGRSEDPCSD